MSLQRRLTWLMMIFVAFALVATFGTIYAVRLHVSDALGALERSMDDAAWVDRLRLEARECRVTLHEAVDGEREWSAKDRRRADALLTELTQLAHMYGADAEHGENERLLGLTNRLRQAMDQCTALLDAGDRKGASPLVHEVMGAETLPALERELRVIRVNLDSGRNRSVDELLASNTQVLILSVVIGVLGIGLVTIGSTRIHRWIIVPIRQLQQAAHQFGEGDLAYRVTPGAGDELGELGLAMNQMAESLASAQGELSHSEAKHRSLFRNLRDTALICDVEGVVVECNLGATGLPGDPPAGCEGRRISDLWMQWHADPIDWLEVFREVTTSGAQVLKPAVRFTDDESGRPTAVDMLAYPVEYGMARHVAVVLRDITARVAAEDALRESEGRFRAMADELRKVTHRLQTIREDERTRIARELHDELGQALTALNMDLHWLRARTGRDSEPVQTRLDSMSELVKSTIASIRRICSDLRPTVLDDFGLVAAIEWQVREFEARTGIRCKLCALPTLPTMPQDQATAVFRIFQESLTNVVRHANASEAEVSLKFNDGTLALRVADNGVGISGFHTQGVGIAGMRERALRWGGRVEINGAAGEGTTVAVYMPVRPTSPAAS